MLWVDDYKCRLCGEVGEYYTEKRHSTIQEDCKHCKCFTIHDSLPFGGFYTGRAVTITFEGFQGENRGRDKDGNEFAIPLENTEQGRIIDNYNKTLPERFDKIQTEFNIERGYSPIYSLPSKK